MNTELRELKDQLARRAEPFLIDLLGEPTARGTCYWRWGSRGSLSYDLVRHHWKNFETDGGGDQLDLICFCNPGWDLHEAIHWARDWLGDAPIIPRHQPEPQPRDTTPRALKLWHEARPARGTLVESYLRQRGLALPPRSANVLRFHPACPRGKARMAAMLGLMRDVRSNQPLGVHRTFLRCDGLGKADVAPNKMMLGFARRAVLKLAPDEDVTMGLALTEGIEDALALINDGWAPVWACLSAGMLASFPVLPGIAVLSVFADNDRAGERAARACVERWQRAGKDALVVTPPRRLKDFGDVAQGESHGR